MSGHYRVFDHDPYPEHHHLVDDSGHHDGHRQGTYGYCSDCHDQGHDFCGPPEHPVFCCWPGYGNTITIYDASGKLVEKVTLDESHIAARMAWWQAYLAEHV